MSKVLITGGTSGIGYELARQFAREGYTVCIVSSSEQRLLDAKTRLEREFAIQVFPFLVDLSQEDGADRLVNQMKQEGHQIQVLVNAAGIGYIGEHVNIDSQLETEMLMLNILTLTKLSRLCINDLIKDGEGRILNISSIGAFFPGTFCASYYASKSYVVQFSRALSDEVRKQRICVSVACPGTTKTAFFERAGGRTPVRGMTADATAQSIYRQFKKGRKVIIPGFHNKCARWLPARLKQFGIASINKKRMRSTRS